jgi:cytochrome c oxidase cbb3-type subunit I/II
MSQSNEGFHSRVIERRAGLLAGLTTIAILIGGIVEVIPMYTVDEDKLTVTEPYTPLEVAGRDIYVREGCYNCHSQMVRPMRSDVLRYGTWSRAAEYQHDRPFQLGSRRIGPDLARVGGKWPNAWHYRHMEDPRSTTSNSIMPNYGWLLRRNIDPKDVEASLRALRTTGEDYSRADIENVEQTLREEAQVIVDDLAESGIETTWDKEIIALIAYLQSLGTDLDTITAEEGTSP